jgi:transposase
MIPGDWVLMPKPRGWHTQEFKAEAVRPAKSGNESVTQTAKDPGIALESLRKWIREAEIEAGLRRDGLTAAERGELKLLRREVRVLQEEREIMRKPPPSSPIPSGSRSKLRPAVENHAGTGVPVHQAREGELCRADHVQSAGCFPHRVQ